MSEFELAATIASGVPPTDILVNGVGKWQWLKKYQLSGLTVHFDSLAEVYELGGMARTLGWRVGVRCAIPHKAGGLALTWDQFGMSGEEIAMSVQTLRSTGIQVRGLHFHLHTNVAEAAEYARAIEHVHRVCAQADLSPEYLDLGGGLPLAGEHSRDSEDVTFNIGKFEHVLRSIPRMFPDLREVWLENGRFLTGAAGALVLTVLDKKRRGNQTYVICDGGRVNHARLAATEVHEIVLEPNRGGATMETVVCGPTCASVDRLGVWNLPIDLVPGDLIAWLNAGAYHIPLETRFSSGLAPVVWFNAFDKPELVRARETPAQWWSVVVPGGYRRREYQCHPRMNSLP